MMMTKEQSLAKMREKGAYDAQVLQTKAVAGEVTETEIIDNEISVPSFDPNKDYSNWKKDSPVADDGQVWLLIQPHNASHYEGRPSTLRALWGLAHTKNPKNAKPYVAPYGTSGLYKPDECMIWTDGFVYICIAPQPTEYTPESYPAWWKKYGE